MEDKLLPSLHGLISKSIAPISSPAGGRLSHGAIKSRPELPRTFQWVPKKKQTIWRCPGGFWIGSQGLGFAGAQTFKNNYIIVEVIWVLGIYSNNPPFMNHKKAIWKITPKSVILWSYCHIVDGRKLSNQSKQLSHETKKTASRSIL